MAVSFDVARYQKYIDDLMKSLHIPFHPLLVALYPILFLYAHNMDKLQMHQIGRTLLLVLGSSTVLLALLYLFLRNIERSALFTSVLLILFFGWGHLLKLISFLLELSFDVQDESVVAPLVLLLMMILSLLFSLLILRRRDKDPSFLHPATACFNVFFSFITIFPLFTIVLNFDLKTQSKIIDDLADLTIPLPSIPKELRRSPATTSRPNVFHIILDGYARQDVLKDIYGHDNTSFSDALQDRGFRLLPQSHANYAQTMLVFASMLNMDYIQNLLPDVPPNQFKRDELAKLTRNSLVSKIFQSQGYHFATFATGYSGTEIPGADRIHTPPSAVNEFESMIIATTPLHGITRLSPATCLHQRHIDRVQFILNHLPKSRHIEKPTYVLAHIMSPHPPFVFAEDGPRSAFPSSYAIGDGIHHHRFQPEHQQQYRDEYIQQLIYISKQILRTIDGILNTDSPTVVLLQSDHGPGLNLHWGDAERTDLRERMGILNAVYANGSIQSELYDTITPVNMYRVFFNHWFGASFPLLENRSYFSTWEEPFRFVESTPTPEQ